MEALLKLLPELFKWFQSWDTNRAGKVIIKTAEVYDNMRYLTDTPHFGIKRVLIKFAHNGGKNLAVGTKSKVTCIHEEVRWPFKSVKNKMQDFDIDGQFNEVLRELYIKKSVDLDVATMPDGALKDQYLSEGVKRARLLFLKESRKYFWFMSIATENELVTFNDVDTRVALRHAVSNIKARV
jgi:hypothetical protein